MTEPSNSAWHNNNQPPSPKMQAPSWGGQSEVIQQPVPQWGGASENNQVTAQGWGGSSHYGDVEMRNESRAGGNSGWGNQESVAGGGDTDAGADWGNASKSGGDWGNT